MRFESCRVFKFQCPQKVLLTYCGAHHVLLLSKTVAVHHGQRAHYPQPPDDEDYLASQKFASVHTVQEKRTVVNIVTKF